MEVEVKFDEKKLRDVQRMLRSVPNAMGKVMSKAINKTITPIKTETAQRIAGDVNLTQKTIKRKIDMEKATRDRWRASIGISRKRISLISFKGTTQPKKGKGVKYRITKSGPRKLVESAFIGTPRRAGVAGVLKRMSQSRYPLAWLKGPSLGQVFEYAGQIAREVTKSAHEKLEKNIDSQVKFLLSKRKTG